MEPPRPRPRKLGSLPRRKSVQVSQQSLVKERPLEPGTSLPLVIEPTMNGVDLVSWAASQSDHLNQLLARHGGLLFRGFSVPSLAAFEKLTAAVSTELLEYKERSSPRSKVEGKIYTSTDYPPEHPIFLHNENSYQNQWPMKIFFYCHTAAPEGGETPIADCRNVYQEIDPEIRQRFADRGWMYQRNFGDGFGLDWQTVFQTEDRDQVTRHCAKNGIQCEWRDGGRLRTRAVRPAVAKHPKTGDMVWFNHATFFHVTTLTPDVRESLLEEFDEEDLPTHTYYGDGSPIEPEVLDHLRSVYERETVRFPWQEGDILMLDNMMVAHGRAPFRGDRKVLVGMAEPWSWDRLEN